MKQLVEQKPAGQLHRGRQRHPEQEQLPKRNQLHRIRLQKMGQGKHAQNTAPVNRAHRAVQKAPVHHLSQMHGMKDHLCHPSQKGIDQKI